MPPESVFEDMKTSKRACKRRVEELGKTVQDMERRYFVEPQGEQVPGYAGFKLSGFLKGFCKREKKEDGEAEGPLDPRAAKRAAKKERKEKRQQNRVKYMR